MRKKAGIIILAAMLLIFSGILAAAAATPGITLEQAQDGIVSYYAAHKNTLDSWEEVVGLNRAGQNLAGVPWRLPDWRVAGLDESAGAINYATTILGMLAAGENPEAVAGRNLVAELAAMQTGDGDFGGAINTTVWSIVALDAVGANYNEAGAVASLLAGQTGDGGFAFSGSQGDPDMTGFALLALAGHRDVAGVDVAIKEAESCLQNLQLENGGFSSWGNESAESIAAVIRGLVACRVDITAAPWQKNGRTMIDRLFDFQLADKSFAHAVGGSGDPMATRQALIAVADLVKANVNYRIGQGEGTGPNPDETVNVRVRVEGATGSLHASEVQVTGTALDALNKAVGEEKVIAPGGFIETILGESGRQEVAEKTATGWNYYVIRNGMVEEEAFNTGAGSYNLRDNDELVFYIGAYDTETWGAKTYLPVIEVSPARPTAGQTVTLNITAKKYVWGAGLQALTAEEAKAAGDYQVSVGEQTYTSQFGQVTIPNVAAGTLEYKVTNANAAGYPDVVTYVGRILVGGSGQGIGTTGITVEIAVVGKNGELLFSPGPVTLSDSDPFGKTVMGALNKTGLPWQFSSQWDGMVNTIGGQRNEGMNGWCFKVNGENPMVLARDYQVAAGSKIIWWYSNDAMSLGPDWNDLLSGQWVAAPKPKEAVDNLKVVKETLALYTGELKNLKGKSKVINQERKMAAEQVKNRQEELAANIVSLKQEVGLSAAVVFDTAGEVALLVPEDALTQIRTLTVKELTVREPDSSTVKFRSSGYDFGPAGLKFAKPVTIAFKAAFVEEINYENLTPARYDHQANQWVPVPGIIDLEKQLVVFETSHFTRFAVIELPEEPVKRISFPDVGPELAWAKDAVEILAGKGILKGTANGFEPARPITRAEFTKLAVTALALPEAQATNDRFIDVNEADWFAGAVAAACQHNLITGYPDGTFQPGQAITRNEVAALFYRLQNKPADQPEPPVVLADEDLIPAWAVEAVQHVNKQGLMRGYEDGTFRGNHPITRAEAAVVFYKYLP